MSALSTYALVSGLIFLAFGVVWSTKNVVNVLMKVFLVLFGIYGLILSFVGISIFVGPIKVL